MFFFLCISNIYIPCIVLPYIYPHTPRITGYIGLFSVLGIIILACYNISSMVRVYVYIECIIDILNVCCYCMLLVM